MAIENARGFVEKSRQDAALQAQLKEVRRQARQNLLAAVAALGNRAGFAFDAAEYEQVVREQAGQLSDEDLKQVTGGAGARPEKCEACAWSFMQRR